METYQPAKVIKGPIKLSDKQREELKKKLKDRKKNQLPQKSDEIKEEAKSTKEVDAKENIKGGSKDEFKTSAEYNDQISNIKSIFKNCSLIKELADKYGEEKVHQIAEQIESIDLVKFLKAKGHSFFPKRIVSVKKIIKSIENWLQYLYCCVKGCPYNAIITYEGESTNQIYCQGHADPKKHKGNQIVFQNELNECVLLLRELEKELLYVQAKILIAKSEDEEDKSNESIIKDLEDKFLVIQNTLNTMEGKIENLVEKSNTKKTTNKDEGFRYRSLSFIKEECIANARNYSLMKNLRVEHILKSQMRYMKKEFNILNVPFQSKILINNFEKKIKKSFKFIKINQKV